MARLPRTAQGCITLKRRLGQSPHPRRPAPLSPGNNRTIGRHRHQKLFIREEGINAVERITILSSCCQGSCHSSFVAPKTSWFSRAFFLKDAGQGPNSPNYHSYLKPAPRTMVWDCHPLTPGVVACEPDPKGSSVKVLDSIPDIQKKAQQYHSP